MERINDTPDLFDQNHRHDAVDYRRRRRLRQVLVDSGMDKYIASIMHESNMSPLFDGVVYRRGAAYRAGFGDRSRHHRGRDRRAADRHHRRQPGAVGYRRWLRQSVIFSHVANDPGFWLFKEYFNLTIGETIKSWSVLETIISVCGLVGCSAAGDGGVGHSRHRKAGP